MNEIKKGTEVLIIDSDEIYFGEISHFDGSFYGLKDRSSVPKEMVWKISEESIQHAMNKLTHLLSLDHEKVNAARRRMRRHERLLRILGARI